MSIARVPLFETQSGDHPELPYETRLLAQLSIIDALTHATTFNQDHLIELIKKAGPKGFENAVQLFQEAEESQSEAGAAETKDEPAEVLETGFKLHEKFHEGRLDLLGDGPSFLFSPDDLNNPMAVLFSEILDAYRQAYPADFDADRFFRENNQLAALVEKKLGHEAFLALKPSLSTINIWGLRPALKTKAPFEGPSLETQYKSALEGLEAHEGMIFMQLNLSVTHVNGKYYAFNLSNYELIICDTADEFVTEYLTKLEADEYSPLPGIEVFTFKALGLLQNTPAAPETPEEKASVSIPVATPTEPETVQEAPTSNISMMVLGGFIAAVGAAAVAVALTLLPLVPCIVVATLGAAAILGGCGLFAKSMNSTISETNEVEEPVALTH